MPHSMLGAVTGGCYERGGGRQPRTTWRGSVAQPTSQAHQWVRGKPGRHGGHSQTPHNPNTRADELTPARIGDIWKGGHIRAETPPATDVGYPGGQSFQKRLTHVGSHRRIL